MGHAQHEDGELQRRIEEQDRQIAELQQALQKAEERAHWLLTATKTWRLAQLQQELQQVGLEKMVLEQEVVFWQGRCAELESSRGSVTAELELLRQTAQAFQGNYWFAVNQIRTLMQERTAARKLIADLSVENKSLKEGGEAIAVPDEGDPGRISLKSSAAVPVAGAPPATATARLKVKSSTGPRQHLDPSSKVQRPATPEQSPASSATRQSLGRSSGAQPRSSSVTSTGSVRLQRLGGTLEGYSPRRSLRDTGRRHGMSSRATGTVTPVTAPPDLLKPAASE